MSPSVNGYTLKSEWTNTANGSYAFATKDGREYFVKLFPYPKFPNKSDYSEAAYKRIKDGCDLWMADQEKLIAALKAASSVCPYIIAPVEVFREESNFYKVSEKVTLPKLSYDEISRRSNDVKMDLTRKFLKALSTLEEQGVVHGDLKHANVLVVEVKGKLEPRIIDFDDSYFSGNPPSPEGTIGSMEFYSPELGYYISSEDETKKGIVTCKSDVFAAGLMIHEYWAGKSVLHGTKYPYQIKKDADLQLSPLPSDIARLLKEMLKRDREQRPLASEAIDILDGKRPRKKVKPSEKEDTVILERERFIRVGPATCKRIGTDGSETIIPTFIAKVLARKAGVGIETPEKMIETPEKVIEGEDIEPVKLRRLAEELTPLGNVILSKNKTSVTVRYKDGSENTMPKVVFDNMCKRGKI